MYTDGSEIGHRVSAALCHKRGTSAIRLPGATSIFNAELHDILLDWMSSEDLKKNTFSCCQIHILVSVRWNVVTLTTIRFLNMLKHIQLSQILVKQLYSAGSPVMWGFLETRELIG